MTGIAINGTLGFAMILAVLFRAGDIDAALEQNPLFPVMAIFNPYTQTEDINNHLKL
jgi:choline transport protein